VFFSWFIIKIPKYSKIRSIEKKREKEEGKRKPPRVFANKKGKSIF
jgi:hypothetical protein